MTTTYIFETEAHVSQPGPYLTLNTSSCLCLLSTECVSMHYNTSFTHGGLQPRASCAECTLFQLSHSPVLAKLCFKSQACATIVNHLFAHFGGWVFGLSCVSVKCSYHIFLLEDSASTSRLIFKCVTLAGTVYRFYSLHTDRKKKTGLFHLLLFSNSDVF